MNSTASFWNFSVGTYRRPGVADACLSLQDRYGLDVNVLLYCCWFGCTRGCLTEAALAAVLAFSQPWADQVVRPLRSARRWMKSAGCRRDEVSTPACLSLRDRIKAAELEAEHLQQQTLAALTEPAPGDPLPSAEQISHTASNLRRYLDHHGVSLDRASLLELAHIVTAAVDGAEADRVVAALGTALAAASNGRG